MATNQTEIEISQSLNSANDSKDIVLNKIRHLIHELGYTIVDTDETKPWGAYYRLSNGDAERFIHEFFPGLTIRNAKLGHDDAELSPKFLIVSPGQRLSWQYHARRAERWRFLTNGAYYASKSNRQGRKRIAKPGDIVQFEQEERHRLAANASDRYTLVAEIWQHTDPHNPSDEADIVRLADDYKRT
ncbi:MAG TPA: hypothetical protein VFQ70_01335 [Candidatus Saccharimonadaceae bacterium]|nr:hypothetical protein [Candidatus Saccharimonadaceae bacterium]